MAGIFSPKIAALVDLGKSVAMGDLDSVDELKTLIDESRSYISDFEKTFKALSVFFDDDEKIEALIRFISQDFKDLKCAFSDLESVINRSRFVEVNPVIYSIEKYIMRLSESVSELYKRSERIESPVPIINYIIKASYKVAKRKIEVSSFAVLVPALASFVELSGKNISGFRALYPKQVKIIKTAEKLLSDLKKGVGALYVFLSENDYVSLVDGIRFLKFASPAFYAVLRLMDAFSAKNCEYSKIPLVDEYCRLLAASKKGVLSANALKSESDKLDALVKTYGNLVDYVSKSHYLPFVRDTFLEVYEDVENFKKYWKNIYKGDYKQIAALSDVDVKRLCSEFEKANESVTKLSKAFSDEFNKVAKTPYIEELKDVIGRYLSGSVVLEYFSTKLEDFALRHQELLYQFRDKAGRNHLSMEAYELLELQKTGVDHLMSFLEDSDKSHLIVGMRDIEASLPRLIEIYLGISPLTKSSRSICSGCGQICPTGERLCPSCGAVIPKTLSYNSEHEEFLSQDPLPARLELLFNAFSQYTLGSLARNDLIAEFKKYRDLILQVKRDYKSKAGTLLNSPDIRERAANFESGIKRLEFTLNDILDKLSSGRDIDGDMQVLRQTGYFLEDIRKMGY